MLLVSVIYADWLLRTLYYPTYPIHVVSVFYGDHSLRINQIYF